MTPNEMRALAEESQQAIWDAELPSMVNKLTAIIWYATAEICERLDKLNNASLPGDPTSRDDH